MMGIEEGTCWGEHWVLYVSDESRESTPKTKNRGAWVAWSVKRPTMAWIMISRLLGLSPMSGFVLKAQSLEPASDSVSPFLFAPPPLTLHLSHKNKH